MAFATAQAAAPVAAPEALAESAAAARAAHGLNAANELAAHPEASVSSPSTTNSTPSAAPNPAVPPVAAAASTAAATTTSEADIARRIAAARARRAARISYHCPACSIAAATPVNIARHVERCCPDLIRPEEAAWAQLDSLPRGGLGSPQHEAVVPLLRAAGQREMKLRRRVLTCVFWSGPTDPETGLPVRLEADEAARRLGLPPARAASLLGRAMASVPLASDPDGPLEVLFEDEHFLAVNQPVGLHTAPIHRFAAGSVVNRVIAHLNRGRRGAAREGQLTLLTPHAADVPRGYLPPLLPVAEPFTLSGGAAEGPQAGDAAAEAAAATTLASEGSTSDHHPQQHQLEPYVLHRLDMATSGLLLFAKRPEVVAGVHRQFRERSVSKLYLAAAVGCPGAGPGSGSGVSSGAGGGGGPGWRFEVDAPIDRHPDHAVARRVAETGKEASTSFAVLASNPIADLGPDAGGAPGMLFHERGSFPAGSSSSTTFTSNATTSSGPGASCLGAAPTPAAEAPSCSMPRGASLLVCAPHSGRTHQIRVHLAHVGRPIVGDDIYGVTGPWIGRQALHAACLSFTHPLTGRRVALSAPLHDDMAACLRGLGLPVPDVGELAEQWGEQLARGPAASGAAGIRAGGGSGRQGRGNGRRARGGG